MHGETCAHEGQLVPMIRKIVEFWLQPVGSRYPTKMAGESCIRKLAHEGQLVAM